MHTRSVPDLTNAVMYTVHFSTVSVMSCAHWYVLCMLHCASAVVMSCAYTTANTLQRAMLTCCIGSHGKWR
jgi:hypothetical protein